EAVPGGPITPAERPYPGRCSTMFPELFGHFFRKSTRKAQRAPRATPRVEPLEDRVVPALARTAPLTLQGMAGTVSLSNTAQLTFTSGNTRVTLEPIASAFNVDNAGNLFELNSNGRLWGLPAGADPNLIGQGGWQLLDINVGTFSLSANGVM